MIVRFFRALGAPLLAFFQYLGEVVLLAADTFRSIFTHKLRWKLFLTQVVEIGLLSQLVVVITGAFTGAVFAAQTFFQFNKIGMGSATGAVVSVSICRELGPVLTALMVAGRVGAAMSAEIGTMKVTEQIDALRALAVSKAFCFGVLIVFISCQKGLSAREGAVGVGRATTEAVVNSSLAILICNFFLTMLLNIIYPAGYQ